jgi:hypothetical protein
VWKHTELGNGTKRENRNETGRDDREAGNRKLQRKRAENKNTMNTRNFGSSDTTRTRANLKLKNVPYKIINC